MFILITANTLNADMNFKLFELESTIRQIESLEKRIDAFTAEKNRLIAENERLTNEIKADKIAIVRLGEIIDQMLRKGVMFQHYLEVLPDKKTHDKIATAYDSYVVVIEKLQSKKLRLEKGIITKKETITLNADEISTLGYIIYKRQEELMGVKNKYRKIKRSMRY